MYVQYIHIILIGKTVLFEQVGEKVSFFPSSPGIETRLSVL